MYFFMLLALFCTAVVSSHSPKWSHYPINKTHILSKRNEALISHCSPEQTIEVGHALAEVELVLDRAHDRLVELFKYVDRGKMPPVSTQNTTLASTFRTFSSLFNRDFPVRNHRTADARQRGIKRVKRIRDITKSLLDNFRGKKIEITCSEDWMATTKLSGEVKDGHMWDNRTSTWEGDGYTYAWHPITDFTGKNEDVYMITFTHMAGPFESVFALNPKKFETRWNTTKFLWGFEKPYTQMEPLKYDLGVWHISELLRFHLSSALILNASRMKDMVGREQPQVLGSEEEREWETVIRMSKCSPSRAETLAYPYTWLVVALYLSRFDWSTGYNRELKAALRS